jgi:heat shock protein HslJ
MDDAERAFRDALHRVDSVKIPVTSLEPADVRRTPGLGIMMGPWLAAAAVLAVVAGIAVWALAGRGQVVTGVPATPPSAVAPARLTGTTWIAAEFYGKPTDFAGDKMPFIEFRTDSTYRGGDPCNGVGGSYRLVGNDLQISLPGAMTEMGCNVAQQQTFLKVLEDTRRVHRDGDTIELLDQPGSVLARFRSSEAYTTPWPNPGPTPTPTQSAEVTPSIGPAPVIGVRIRNTSSVDFSDVYAVFPNGKKVHYGPVAAGGTSKYEPVLEAYSYTSLTVKAGGRTYVYQPVDYVGESVLPNGQYSYALNLVGSRIDLTLEHD